MWIFVQQNAQNQEKEIMRTTTMTKMKVKKKMMTKRKMKKRMKMEVKVGAT